MTVRTFFFACLTAAAGVALLAALVTVATEWRHFAQAGEASRTARAIGAALEAAEALALEGNGLSQALLADGATATSGALAGRRTGIYAPATGTREPLEEEALERMAALGGRIDQGWLDMSATIARLGDPPRLVAARATVEQRFRRDATALHKPFDEAARAGGVYPLGVMAYLEQVAPPLQSILAIRDAGVAEALDHAGEARAGALRSLLLALGLVLLVVAVIVAVGMLF